MQRLQHIYRAIEYIEHNLKEPLTVKKVAESAGLSLYYFIRLFTTQVGHSPYDYIMRRRLSEAAHSLLHTDLNIIDIAFEYQFNNPETFSRAFNKMFGTLPNQARKQHTLEKMICKTASSYEYLQHINKGGYLKPELIIHDTLYLIGISSWSRQKEFPDELADRLQREAVLIADLVLPEKYYILSVYTTERDAQTFTMLAVETTSLTQIPWMMVGKVLPPLTYARFIHKGTYAELPMTHDYMYQTWLPKSGHHLAAPFMLHSVGNRFDRLEQSEAESVILLPIN